ncbi:hypothetical protein HCZ80_06960 [Limosilactobacillus fermentum]
MEMTYEQYLGELESEWVHVTTGQVSAAVVQQATTLKAGLMDMAEQIATGHLSQYNWEVKVPVGDPVSVRLEMNLINVPMAEAQRLDPKLLERDQPYPVKVYMIVEGEQLNQSGLRIDELGDADAVSDQPNSFVTPLGEWLVNQLSALTQNRAAQEEDD